MNASNPAAGRRGVTGFTLIELMITVAIVAILAAIALPAYKNAVLKGKRAEGRAALIDLLQQQERYFTQQNKYLPFTAGATGTPFKTWSGEAATSSSYLMSAATCPGTPTPAITTCVQITAERQPNTNADPDARNLVILSSGKKSCTGDKPSVCWP